MSKQKTLTSKKISLKIYRWRRHVLTCLETIEFLDSKNNSRQCNIFSIIQLYYRLSIISLHFVISFMNIEIKISKPYSNNQNWLHSDQWLHIVFFGQRHKMQKLKYYFMLKPKKVSFKTKNLTFVFKMKRRKR